MDRDNDNPTVRTDAPTHSTETLEFLQGIAADAASMLRGDASASSRLRDRAASGRGTSDPTLAQLAGAVARLASQLEAEKTQLRAKSQQLELHNRELTAAVAALEDHERELTDLYAVATALTSRLDSDELVLLLEEKAKSFLDADVCILAVRDRPSGALRVIGPGLQLLRAQEVPEHVDSCEMAAVETAQTGDPRFLRDVPCSRLCRFSRLAQSEGVHHALSVPLRTAGRLLGAISVFRANKRPFDRDDERKLAIIAGAAAIALENAEAFQREHNIADKLQSGLQSGRGVAVPGFEISSEYLPVAGLSRVGGDFHDVVDLGAGAVGVVMADISGKGIDAAVHTAMVRFTLRGIMLAESDPAAVLQKLNGAVSSVLPDDVFVTLFCGRLDTMTGEMMYANAGHEQPLLVLGGKCTSCEVTGRPIGTDHGEEYTKSAVRFGPGDLMVLFTDGITEARRGDDLFGVERLRKLVCDNARFDTSTIAALIIREAKSFSADRMRDDVGLLVIKAAAVSADG